MEITTAKLTSSVRLSGIALWTHGTYLLELFDLKPLIQNWLCMWSLEGRGGTVMTLVGWLAHPLVLDSYPVCLLWSSDQSVEWTTEHSEVGRGGLYSQGPSGEAWGRHGDLRELWVSTTWVWGLDPPSASCVTYAGQLTLCEPLLSHLWNGEKDSTNVIKGPCEGMSETVGRKGRVGIAGLQKCLPLGGWVWGAASRAVNPPAMPSLWAAAGVWLVQPWVPWLISMFTNVLKKASGLRTNASWTL